jgi:hypothetical protein
MNDLNAAHHEKFKAKKRWWIWGLAILAHVIVVRLWFLELYFFPIIAIILDFVLLPDVTHRSYVIDDKFLIIKTLFYPVYPSEEIALHMITAVEKTTLMTFRGFGVYMNEASFSAYKILYSESKGRIKSVIVSPKDHAGFVAALASRVEKGVILIDNRESAFKKKKDEK